MKILAWGTFAALAAVMSVEAQPTATSCSELTALNLPHVTITEATMVSAGATYCKVLGTRASHAGLRHPL